MTMEQVLRTIKQERGMSALRSQEQLVGLFKDFSKNQLRPQANALKVFLDCQGSTRILNLQNATAQERQVQFHRLVREMAAEHNMQEETAVEVCSAFWRVALETVPPEYTLRQLPSPPAPEPTSAPQHEKIKEPPREEKHSPIPDPPTPDPKPKPRHFQLKHFVGLLILVVLVLAVVAFLNDSTGKRTRSDLAPFQLEDSIEDMLLAGTEDIYTYPDGTRMEFYFDDSGKELCRVYVNTENEIENLFDARYDSAGRLVYHQIFDGEGNLLRADSYDFHSSEDTAQRRVSLSGARGFQGISTFKEDGTEKFTVTHEDGSQTVYQYEAGGLLTEQIEYDPAGEILDWPISLNMEGSGRTWVYGPQNKVIGWTNPDGYTSVYIQGPCGGALKEYSVSEEAAFIETYDPMGNLLEEWYYQDGQLNDLFYYEVHSYDQQGNYNGYTSTTYHHDGDYFIEQYDANGIRLSQEIHRFEGEEEVVLYNRYETELDDQGREVCVREFDGETGRLISVDETEYDQEGNEAKTTRTYYHDNGDYNITIRDGEGKILSDITYYSSGSVHMEDEYNSEGKHIKSTWYYENGQAQSITEYSGTGETLSRVRYYESGQTQYLDEYDAQGNLTKSTSYYESGKIDNLTEYNSQGDISKMARYYENGQPRYLIEYNDQGEVIRQVYYNEDGTVIE